MADEPSALATLLTDLGLASRDEPAQLEPLAGGYRNRVYLWRRSAPHADAIVKVFVEASDNPLFPTLPDHEAAALALLVGQGLAPEPLAYHVDSRLGHVLVYLMVVGEPWWREARQVGRLLRAIHGVAATRTEFRFRPLVHKPDEVAAQAMSIVDRLDEAALVKRLTRLIDRTRRAAGTAVGPTCLVHTDPGPGNVIVGANGPRLIDWQCPGMGDPVEDLAGFASPAIQILYERSPLAPADIVELLGGYDDSSVGNETTRAATTRYDDVAPLYRARTAAYCAYRMLVLRCSEPDVSARYASALHAEFDGLNG